MALTLLEKAGLLRRVYKVVTPSGALAEENQAVGLMLVTRVFGQLSATQVDPKYCASNKPNCPPMRTNQNGPTLIASVQSCKSAISRITHSRSFSCRV